MTSITTDWFRLDHDCGYFYWRRRDPGHNRRGLFGAYDRSDLGADRHGHTAWRSERPPTPRATSSEVNDKAS